VTISTEKLLAFVDGELNPSERAEVEAAMAGDTALRDRVEREQRMRRRLAGAFDPTLDEAVPPRLAAALATGAADNVAVFAPKRARVWSTREWGAMAASLAAGLIIGLGVMSAQAPLLAPSANGLTAHGALAQALESQVAANTDANVRIGISFQSHDGDYCRTFGVAREHLAGLACKVSEQWRVPVAAQLGSAGGEIRTAGADAPAPVLNAVDAMIAGDPLDAAGEAQARANHWRVQPRS
jgi:hypothetical protein